jgi:hypothetical protein
MDVDPHLPFARFSLRMPDIGVARDTGRLRGYLTPQADGSIELSVHLPDGVAAPQVTTWAGKTPVTHRTDGGVVRFTVPGTAGARADWAVTWG